MATSIGPGVVSFFLHRSVISCRREAWCPTRPLAGRRSVSGSGGAPAVHTFRRAQTRRGLDPEVGTVDDEVCSERGTATTIAVQGGDEDVISRRDR